MAEETQTITIEREAVYVDEELIIVPLSPLGPISEPTEEDIEKLYPDYPDIYRDFSITRVIDRDLLINIETTGLLPFESRIFSIAYQDLTDPNSSPMVLIKDNEEELIDEFLAIIDNGNWTRLVGWNLSFDYRFIFGVACLYRRPSPKFYNLKLRDVQQIYQQVKEAYVYGFQKPNKLDEWGKFLLGKGKYAEQEEVLSRYISGDFNFIKDFQERQIELTRELYYLALYCATASPQTPISTIPATTSASSSQYQTSSSTEPGQKQCSNCLAFQPLENTTCSICGVNI